MNIHNNCSVTLLSLGDRFLAESAMLLIMLVDLFCLLAL